jgi:Mg-chelatase subunit ChlI
LKLSLILNVIDPKIGGVMIMGECGIPIKIKKY